MARRCICGRSRTLPLCDGSHRSDAWTCAPSAAVSHARLFVAAPHNANIAERLAHARQGVALHHLDGPVSAEEVVVITDGAGLDLLTTALRRVTGQRQRVLLIGGDPAMLGGVLGGAVVAVPDADHPALLWRSLLGALEAPVAPAAGPPPRLFLSHASADEAVLAPAVAVLRRLGVEVFVCGDSIPGGARWWDTILTALHRCDRFVLVLSQAARRSTWCAFEVGAAVVADKPIRLISLDGLPPPSFVSHLQMSDLPRIRAQRPWLSEPDAIIEALLSWPDRVSRHF
jgi:hypothetical protein